MTGWVQKQDTLIRPGTGTTPSAATLSEVAAAAQREQLAQLIDALSAHPDLAARVYVLLRNSP